MYLHCHVFQLCGSALASADIAWDFLVSRHFPGTWISQSCTLRPATSEKTLSAGSADDSDVVKIK